MVGREVQRFEVVIIGLDNRPFLDGITQVSKYRYDLMDRVNDGVFGADRAALARERDVESLRRKLGLGGAALDPFERGAYQLFDAAFQLINSLPGLAFCFFGRRL